MPPSPSAAARRLSSLNSQCRAVHRRSAAGSPAACTRAQPLAACCRRQLPAPLQPALLRPVPQQQPAARRPVSCRAQRETQLHSLAPLPLLAAAAAAAPALGELGEGLEAPVQLLYLLTLLGFLVVGAFLVVRQVLIRRELEEAAKVLGERIRTGDASSEDCFELGVILLRKKLYTQAVKNLEKAKRTWDGEPEELAQVHNALGFAYFSMEKAQLAVAEYRRAVELQPGYVTAWNNLGDAAEKLADWPQALKAYEEALSYAPDNKVALARSEAMRNRVGRIRV